MNAKSGIEYNAPITENPKPNEDAIVAPTLAPADTPIMYGSANGLRSNPWRVAPDVANPIPTMAAAKTRGNLTVKTISWLTGDALLVMKLPSKGIFDVIVDITSDSAIGKGPIETAMTMAIKKQTTSSATVVFHFFARLSALCGKCSFRSVLAVI